jgi:hypothetical protein
MSPSSKKKKKKTKTILIKLEIYPRQRKELVITEEIHD